MHIVDMVDASKGAFSRGTHSACIITRTKVRVCHKSIVDRLRTCTLVGDTETRVSKSRS
jgi:hypothetical protein